MPPSLAPTLPAVAQTKVCPPRPRDHWIARPMLDAALAAAIGQHRLVLVSAPAGFGKTTALARLAAALDASTALAWVALDEEDDLLRLLEALVAALEPHDLPWRVSPQVLIAQAVDPAATAAQRRAVADAFVQALQASEAAQGLIVLDDLHRVADDAAFEWLDALLARLPVRWTVLAATRVDPPLALPRLRAQSELAEFRQAELAFALDEVRALTAGTPLPEAELQHLLQRTQGWPAGLRLMLNAQAAGARAQGTARVDRQVFEYIADEVVDELPEALRDFLLATSVLPELVPARCEALWGRPGALRQLQEIERRGLFVTALDDDGTLRLHDLFRQALEHRLERSQPERLPELWRRAATDEPDPARRVTWLLRAGDLDAATGQLWLHVGGLLTRGATAQVQRLLEQFPASWRAQSARVHLTETLLAWARWDFDAMLHHASAARERYAARGDVAGGQRARTYEAVALLGQVREDELSALLATLRREPIEDPETRALVLMACAWHAVENGALQRVGPVMAEQMQALRANRDPALWYQCQPSPRCVGLPGAHAPLSAFTAIVLDALAGEAPSPLRAVALLLRGWQCVWEGRLTDAAAALADALDDCRWLGDPLTLVNRAAALQAWLRAVCGDAAGAARAARERLTTAPVGSHLGVRRQLWWFGARVAAIAGDTALLREMLDELERPDPHEPAQERALRTALPGHLAALEGRWADALGPWTAALRDEARIDAYGLAGETRLRLAHALLHLGRGEAAGEAVADWLATAASDNALGAALCVGPAVLLALVRGVGGTHLPDAPRTALARLGQAVSLALGPALAGPALAPGAAPDSTAAQPAPPAPAPERDDDALARAGLSPREIEVLTCIARGDSNKLIARHFELSPHTVKRHVANILDKLGLDSRGQAAAWWRDHGH